MSFNIALSGLNAVNSSLSQISNNIANSGTVGFKSGAANFASAYVGGKVGGVYLNSISQSIGTGGTINATGRGLDAAINGRGFFVVASTDGSLVYTRAGQFTVDKDGYLVDAANRRVQGYSTDSNGAVDSLKVPTAGMAAVSSTQVDYAGNMSADWVAPTAAFDQNDATSYNGVQVTSVYDSLGRQHTLSQYFVRGTGNEVTVHYALDGALTGATGDLQFDTNGRLATPAAPMSVSIGTPDGAEPLALDIDYAGTTFFGGDFSTATNMADGNAPGTLVNVSLTADGSVQLEYSNNLTLIAGQLALATFPAEDVLTAVDGTGWKPNAETGDPIYGRAGTGLIGDIATASLETSNVDMATELVNLMSAQQNYQANSKVLTSESEMIKTLMQSL